MGPITVNEEAGGVSAVDKLRDLKLLNLFNQVYLLECGHAYTHLCNKNGKVTEENANLNCNIYFYKMFLV